MKLTKLQKGYLIYAIPMSAAVLVRIVLYWQWYNSPFRYYHTLVGLDMRNFLIWGEQLYQGTNSFSMYKLLVAVLYAVVGKEYLPETIIAVQMIFGVLLTGMTVYVFRHTFRNKTGALIAGLFCGLYAPLLLYETHVLKESLFLFLSFLALSLLIAARKYKFPPSLSYIAGAAAILPFFVRFSGLLWFIIFYMWLIAYCRKKNRALRSFMFVILGSLTVMGLVAFYSISKNQPLTRYFTPNTPYLLGVGATTNIKDLSYREKKESSESSFSFILHYLKKPCYIFSAYEQPNNLNYYFIRSKLSCLRFLTNPLILIPISAAGLLLILLNFKKQKKSSLLLLYLTAFIIPMILFLPLARYKIVLIPVFSIFAAFWIISVIRILYSDKKKRLIKPFSLYIITLALSLTVFYFSEIPIRNSDEDGYRIAARYQPAELIQQGKLPEAITLLSKYYDSDKNNSFITLTYTALLLGVGDSVKVQKILIEHGIPNENTLKGSYFFTLAEASLLQEKRAEAVRYYDVALKYPLSDQRRKLALQRIETILKEKQ